MANETEYSQVEHTDKFHRLGVQQVTAVALAADFRPIRILSRGGMGVILLAQELVTKRLVAIKVLNSETKNLLPLAQQFMREAVITARLQHPNIVPVYRLGFLDGDRSHPHLFFSMKFIEGSSYASVRARMKLAERIKVLAGAAAALAYAHGKKLWHRDVKPDNVMLGPHDDVYVVDWGLVTITPGEDYRLDLPEVAMLDLVQPLPEDIDTLLKETPEAVTKAGDNTLLGTPLYMAPEQIPDFSHPMGPPADIWALGVMLFEALCDRHPYVHDPDASNFEILSQTSSTRIESVQRVAPGTPAHLADLCDRMLSRSRDARPPATEVLESLRQPIDPAPGRTLVWGSSSVAAPARPLADALPPQIPGVNTPTPVAVSTMEIGMPGLRTLAAEPAPSIRAVPAMPMPRTHGVPDGAPMMTIGPPEVPPEDLASSWTPSPTSAPFRLAPSGAAPPALHCPYCGAATLMNAIACGTCGRPLPPRPAPWPLRPLDPVRDAPGALTALVPNNIDGLEFDDGEPRSSSLSMQHADREVAIEKLHSLAVVSPTGYRVEGLTIEQALALLKGLGG